MIEALSKYATFEIRAKVAKKITASHQALLDELEPSDSQLERGLALHYESYVADLQGGINVSSPFGFASDRFEQETARGSEPDMDTDDRLDPVHPQMTPSAEVRRRMRTFDSAFNEQAIEDHQNLYRLTGVDCGTEDVAHPYENTFELALKHTVRTDFVHEMTRNVLRISGMREIDSARRSGIPAMILHLAGTGCFADAQDPIENLDFFYALGVRMSQLTYGQDNALCTSWVQEHDKGLTRIGRNAVRRMNELGLMVDIAHCGSRSAHDIVDASEEPVILSHTGCSAVHDPRTNDDYMQGIFSRYDSPAGRANSSRNAGDDLLRRVAQREGLVCIFTLGRILGDEKSTTGIECSFSTFAEHLEHAVKIAGIDHVGIGADRGFSLSGPPDPMDWCNWPLWTVGLVCRGFDDEEIRKIIGGNFLRYAETVLDRKPWGPFM